MTRPANRYSTISGRNNSLEELRERQAHRKAINEQDVATEKRLQKALDAKTYDRPASAKACGKKFGKTPRYRRMARCSARQGLK